MANRHTTFPIAEGLGIFIGIVAWDLLADGRLEVIKALLITTPCTLVWFALRWWRNNHPHDHPGDRRR